MIQRIQTVFLLIAAIAFGLLFQFPFASSTSNTGKLFSDGVYNLNDHTILLVLSILGAVLALVNIFLFKNRPLQSRLSYLIVVFGVLLAFVATFFFMNESKDMADTQVVNDQAGMYMPILVIVFGILASVFINKDEKLVRSSDRLR